MNDNSQGSESFGQLAQFYDLFYNHKDYAGETNYVIDLLRRFSPGARSLLELGFGTGNYTMQLCKAGYKVTGIEKSKYMVEVAAAKSIPHFSPLTGDINSFNLEEEFDAAISLFHVISYLTINDEILNGFHNVYKHLKSKGIFIFDVWYTPAVYHQHPQTSNKHYPSAEFEISRLAEPVICYETNTVEVNYTLHVTDQKKSLNRILKETHTLRHFSTPEVKLFAQLSGFKLIGSEEFFTAKKPGPGTWGVCFILQKND